MSDVGSASPSEASATLEGLALSEAVSALSVGRVTDSAVLPCASLVATAKFEGALSLGDDNGLLISGLWGAVIVRIGFTS